MKRLISLTLIFILSLGMLVGCKSKYPAQKSTKEEARVVMTLSFDGEEYDVKYELYRALFLANKSAVDGGDSSVWSGSKKDEYVNKINKLIIDGASEIYSAMHLSDKLGFDLYSKEANKEVEEFVRIAVEGNGADIIGYGGDYDAYLADLAKRGLNYSVQDLLFRYSMALEKINEYYLGTEDAALGTLEGEYKFSVDDVREFYFGSESVRILHAYMQADVIVGSYERMESLREKIATLSPKEAALYIIQNTSATPTDLIINKEVSGIVFGNYTTDDVYSDYREAAFSLTAGEVSEIIEINDGVKGYYVIYKLDKDEAHFTACYEDIKLAYLDNVISRELIKISDGLTSGAKMTKKYGEIVHSEISAK